MRRLRRARPGMGLLLAAGLLCGCAQEGDFGRREPSVLTDQLLPWAKSVEASAHGDTIPDPMMTDDERTLRDRAWRFIAPTRPRSAFDALLAEWREDWRRSNGIVGPTTGDYFAALSDEDWRSSATPYRKLAEDIDTDAGLYQPLCAVVDAVRDTDGVRARGLPLMQTLTPAERDSAMLRMSENADLIRLLGSAVRHRIEAYRSALEHLFAEAPQRDSVDVDHRLAAFQDEIAARNCLWVPAANYGVSPDMGSSRQGAVYKP